MDETAMAFADFPEQQRIAQLLQRSLERGRLGHAYLFTGSDLADLETMARTLAKTLNCLQPPSRTKAGLPLDSCDACSNCLKIDRDAHHDVQWVRPESKSRIITIDQIREVMQTVQLKPHEAAYKIAVIEDADRLNVHAANAFLKTLEEPPPQSILVLLSSDPQRILDTLHSRCLRLNFAATGHTTLASQEVEWLQSFARQASAPSPGLLLRYRLLGELQERLGRLRERIEAQLSETSPLAQFPDAEPPARDRWEDELKAAVEAEYRRQRTELLKMIQTWLRDIWLMSHLSHPSNASPFSADANAAGMENLLDLPALAEYSRRVGERLPPEKATENIRSIETTQRILHTNVQEALALEVGLLKLHFTR